MWRRTKRRAAAVEQALVSARRPLAWVLLLAALALDVGAWAGVIAKHEPKVVLHLSTWALIYTAFTTVFVAERR